MLRPFLSDFSNIQKLVPTQLFSGQQIFSPFPQGSSEPATNWDTKTHLRTLHQFPRNVLVKNLPKNPFTCFVPDLQMQRESPSKLNHTMVEQRNSCFKAYCHACAVDFSENIIRQIIQHISQHH